MTDSDPFDAGGQVTHNVPNHHKELIQAAKDAARHEGWEGGHCRKMAGRIIDAQDAALASLEEQKALRNFNAATKAAYATLISSEAGVGAVSPSGSPASDPAKRPT